METLGYQPKSPAKKCNSNHTPSNGRSYKTWNVVPTLFCLLVSIRPNYTFVEAHSNNDNPRSIILELNPSPTPTPLTYLFHVVTSLRTGFNEHHIQFFRFPLAFFRRDLALVREVSFVAHQHDDYVTATLRPDVVDPFRCLVKWVGICVWEKWIEKESRETNYHRAMR